MSEKWDRRIRFVARYLWVPVLGFVALYNWNKHEDWGALKRLAVAEDEVHALREDVKRMAITIETMRIVTEDIHRFTYQAGLAAEQPRH